MISVYDRQLPLKSNVTITSLEVQLHTLQIKALLNLKYVFEKGLAELTWNPLCEIMLPLLILTSFTNVYLNYVLLWLKKDCRYSSISIKWAIGGFYVKAGGRVQRIVQLQREGPSQAIWIHLHVNCLSLWIKVKVMKELHFCVYCRIFDSLFPLSSKFGLSPQSVQF